MIDVDVLVETKTKTERQSHIDLTEGCVERGGTSTNHKGVLAQYLETTIPYKTVYCCHACNNAKCSNPKHLYWGTQRENSHDSIAAGTYFGGVKPKPHPHTQETKEKISRALKGRPSNNRLGVNGDGKGKPTKGYKRRYKQMWITDGVQSTRIPLQSVVPDGWTKGRSFGDGAIGGATDSESVG